MGSEPCTWLVAFSAPAGCRGKTGRLYTSYALDGDKALVLEDAAAFLGVRVDSGTFRED